MNPEKRALEYVMHHLKEVDALDGKTDGIIHMSKAEAYLNAEIKKHPAASLEAQHLSLFREMIEQYNGKEVRKLPPEFMIKWGMPEGLKTWFEKHPEDPWQLPAPGTPKAPIGKTKASKIGL